MGKNSKLMSVFLLIAMITSLILPSIGLAAPARDTNGKLPKGQTPAFVDDEVIVKFKPGVSKYEIESSKSKVNIQTKKKYNLTGSELVKITSGEKVEDIVAQLKKDPNVDYAQPNYRYYPRTTVNDPDFGQLWGLNNTGQAIQSVSGVTDQDIDAPEAWNLSMGSSSVIVAVIDQGVDINHPDLAANIWTNPGEIPGNGIDDDGNGLIDDVNGWDFYHNDNTVFHPADIDEHGTHIAGTIAAVANNAKGIAGVAPNVKIMPLKWMGPNGGLSSDAIAAIQYATQKGARISNDSWGSNTYDQALYDAISASGQIFVAAAGNSTSNNDTFPDYPSGYNLSNILSVAAVDNKGGLAGFSNYGAATVDVGAPGKDIYSTRPVYPAMGAGLKIYDTVYNYKAVHFGFGLEDLPSPADAAAVLRNTLNFLDTNTSTQILLVDDDNSERNAAYPDYRSVYTQALSSGGYTNVTQFIAGDNANGPSAAAMTGKTVIWFTGKAFGNDNATDYTLTVTDLLNLYTFLNNGGRLLLIGRDLTFGNEHAPLFNTYMEEDVIGDFSPSNTITDTVSGTTYAMPADSCRDTLVPAGSSTPMYNYIASDPATAYHYLSGTSMAAPHAAGIAALMLSVNPSLTNTQVINLMKQTVDPLPSLSGKTVTGGMVNAYKAVLAAKVPDTPTGVTATPGNQTVQLSWNAVSDGDLAGYNIYRDNVKINTSVVTGTSYTNTGLTNGTTYGYQVSSVDTYGFESPKSSVVNISPGQVSVTLTVTGQTAVKNGDSLVFGGTTTVGATVYSAKLEQLDSGGTPIPAADISVTPAISGSTISGSYPVAAFDASAKSVRLCLTVTISGVQHSTVSAPLMVDNTQPAVSLSYNRTSPVGPGTLVITATFSEALTGTPTIDVNQPGTTDITGAAMSSTADPKIWIYNYVVSAGAGYADGTATVTVHGLDAAANANTTATNNSFVIDTTPSPPPIIFQVGGKSSPALSNNVSPQVVVNSVYSGDTIKIFDGSSQIASQLAGGTTVTISLPALSQGLHTLTAKAVDPASNVSSASNSFSYTLDTTAPSAPVIATAGGKTSPALSNNANPQLTINGVVNGDKIEVFDNGTLINSGTAAGTSIVIQLTGLAEGGHTLTVKATDPAGNTSAPSTAFTYAVDTVAPAITVKNPLANATGVSATNNLEITFSEPMNPVDITGANITLTSAVYGTEPITVTYDSTNKKAILDPVSRLKYLTQYTITVSSAIYDPAGNTLSGAPVTWNFTTEPDTYPPDIVPVTASSGVTLSSPVVFGFDEEVVYSTVYNAIYNNQIILQNGSAAVVGTVNYNQATKQVTITPAANLEYGTTYTVSVTGISDLLGNMIVSPRTWSFTTVSPPYSGGSSGGGGGGIVASNGESEIKETIPNSGGTVSSNDHSVTVEIPVGALDPGISLSLTAKPVPPSDIKTPAPQGLQLISDSYEFGPSGKQFLKPVKITLKYDADKVGSGEVAPYYLNEAKSIWEIIANATVDKSKGTVTFETTHFSKYAIMGRPAAVVKTFDDITNHWAKADIEFIASQGIVSGKTNKLFDPNGKVTRAEFARMIVGALGLTPEKGNKTFADVKENAWYYQWVETAAKAGIIAGSNGKFRPGDMVTREEMAAMIVKALVVKNKTLTGSEADLVQFADRGAVSSWARSAMGQAVSYKVVNGRSNTKLAPVDNATRAEAAVMVKKLLGLL